MKKTVTIKTKGIIKKIESSDFLIRCAKKKITKKEIMNWMLQDYLISQNFVRMISRIIVRCEHMPLFATLTENLFEELGEGNLSKAHYYLKYELLKSCGVSDFDVQKNKPSIATEYHLHEGFRVCTDLSLATAIGFLWGNEELVPYEYERLKTGTLCHFPNANTAFFEVNIDSDEQHAENIITHARYLLTNNQALNDFKNGVEVSVNCRLKFYEGLVERQ
ncbi:MAG: iron-containing redox enzyme family protein [Deltaproteobacteria bacterium]|nr:iron-containing redox enzyme family protein [Deltaproteobacteria bacterium]